LNYLFGDLPMNIASLEDDLAQAQLINETLKTAGYSCITFSQGKTLLGALTKPSDFDLLLLDWEMPGVNGMDIVRWVRANLGPSMPVIFLTSRDQEKDLIIGLQEGADDYITKPIKPGELLARIQALLRRSKPTESNQAFSCGPYLIDPDNDGIRLHGELVELAPKEFELALLLFRNPDRLFSRDVLSFNIWNREIPATSRTLDTHLSNIRRKLQLRPENGVRLTSSYALGYRLEIVADPLTAS
jgi:DNA-binding response OmpR family regulator